MVPNLRFPDFVENWNKVKLRDVSRYFNGGSFEGDVKKAGKYELITLKSINVNGELVSSKRFIDNDTNTLSKGTLIMILSEQAPGLLGMTTIIPEDNKYVLNQRVAEIRPNDKAHNLFLSLAINTKQRYFSKHGAGTKVQNISKPNVEKFEFCLPEKKEQQKIASFLSSVDEKISQLEKKKTLLETYKRGIMQKVFSQELRFRDENGQEFSEWELTDLGSISDIKIGEFVIKTKQNPNGKFPVYNGGKTETGYYDEYNNEGDKVIISARGANAGYVNYEKNRFWGGNSCYSIKILNGNNTIFFFQQIKHFQRKFTDYQQAANIPSVSKKDVAVFKVSVPIKKEQQKIALFLSGIDKKIEITSTQLEKTREFKKGLLQQMFV